MAGPYSCLSRSISVLTNKICGIPIPPYCDDIADMAPERLSEGALATFRKFSDLVGYFLKNIKTDIGIVVAFLGIWGNFETPKPVWRSKYRPHRARYRIWAARIGQLPGLGVITEDKLGGLIGSLSFPQTSIFGRFRGPFLAPLRAKNNDP